MRRIMVKVSKRQHISSIKNIQGLDEINEKSLKEVKGIGKSLCEKIMSIVNTGTCNAYEKIKGQKRS